MSLTLDSDPAAPVSGMTVGPVCVYIGGGPFTDHIPE